MSYALGLVDAIFSFFGIYDSGLMSDVHWIIRIIVFIGLSLLCIGIAKLVNFLLSIPWWVYVIVVVLIVGIIILIIVLRHKKSKKKSKEKSEGNNLDNK